MHTMSGSNQYNVSMRVETILEFDIHCTFAAIIGYTAEDIYTMKVSLSLFIVLLVFVLVLERVKTDLNP